MKALFVRRLSAGVIVTLRVDLEGSPSVAVLADLASLLGTFHAGVAVRCPQCACEAFCECALPCRLCAALAQHQTATARV